IGEVFRLGTAMSNSPRTVRGNAPPAPRGQAGRTVPGKMAGSYHRPRRNARGEGRHRRRRRALLDGLDPPSPKDQRMNFASDNVAGAAPGVIEAVMRANAGAAPAYG